MLANALPLLAKQAQTIQVSNADRNYPLMSTADQDVAYSQLATLCKGAGNVLSVTAATTTGSSSPASRTTTPGAAETGQSSSSARATAVTVTVQPSATTSTAPNAAESLRGPNSLYLGFVASFMSLFFLA